MKTTSGYHAQYKNNNYSRKHVGIFQRRPRRKRTVRGFMDKKPFYFRYPSGPQNKSRSLKSGSRSGNKNNKSRNSRTKSKPNSKKTKISKK